MLSFMNLPLKILNILEGNISSREIAAGACLGVFLGLIPLNGPTAFILAAFFFIFKINRIAVLLTLSLVKPAYLLGVYKLADIVGTYILDKADYLTGFWTNVTHLPVIAYLDINNTLVAGGLVISIALSMPIYFIAKKLSIFLSAKYSQKIKNSPIAKWLPSIKLSALMGDDLGATLDNVKGHLKTNLTGKIKQAIFKKKAQSPPNSLFKRLYVVRIVIFISLLLAVHIVTGFFISPVLSPLIANNINKYTSAKISIDKVNVWPLTLSFSLKGMKVFDPEKETTRIAKIDNCSVRVSIFGLLSRRLVFSDVRMSGVEINVEGRPDGTFNISNLVVSNKPAPDIKWRSLMANKDLFGKIYEIIKNHFSKKDQKKVKEEQKNAKKITKTIQQLPKGKLVHFKNSKDFYIFEIRKLDISDAYITINTSGNVLEITKARMRLGQLALDPESGIKAGLVDLRGNVNKGSAPAGKFNIFFSQDINNNGQEAVFKANLEDIDMQAVRFVYGDSLPVYVAKGLLTLKSETYIEAGAMDSRNEIHLKNHLLQQKLGENPMMGFLPVSVVCDAINRIDPLTLNFNIGGTLERPEFKGFQDLIMTLIKPYTASFQPKDAVGALLSILKNK